MVTLYTMCILAMTLMATDRQRHKELLCFLYLQLIPSLNIIFKCIWV